MVLWSSCGRPLLSAWLLAILTTAGGQQCVLQADGSCAPEGLAPFPKVPDFDRCSFHYQKQRAASLVMLQNVDELSRTHGSDADHAAGLQLLESNAKALDPPSHHENSKSRFDSIGPLPVREDGPCPPRPALPQRILKATKVEQVTFSSLLRVCQWYDKPLLVVTLSDSPFKAHLRNILLKITKPFLDRFVVILAEGQDMYDYSVVHHINTLSGKRITYFADHAVRALNPTDSFNWDPVNNRIDDKEGFNKFLQDYVLMEDGRRDTIVPCAGKEGEAARRKRSPNATAAKTMLSEAAKGKLPFPPRPVREMEIGYTEPLPMEEYIEVPRVSGLSSIEFMHRYFLRGHPVILTGAMTSWPAFGTWTRPWMNRRFAKEIVQDGYGANDSVASNWIVASRLLRKKMARWYYLPYLWNLGCQEGNCTDGPLRGIHEGASISSTAPMAAPYFYGSPNKGYASKKHLDTNCHQTYSAQLEGYKQWLLWPPREHGGFKDPEINKPMIAILYPGDIILWYSGWWHEARTIDDKHSLAFTDFFSHPVPTTFLWENREFLLNQKYYATCGSLWRVQTGLPFEERKDFSPFFDASLKKS